MKRFLLALLVPVITLLAHINCWALVASPDIRETSDRARAVFIGEVIEIKKPISTYPSDRLADRLYKVSFKVEYSWKGAGFQEFGIPGLVVLSDQGRNDDCLWSDHCLTGWGEFLEGRKYLVFAEETSDKDLVVWWYSRTVPLFKASEDLKELQRMSSPFYGLRLNRRAEQALGADSP